MTLFGYLFDSNFKEQREREKKMGEAPDEVVDPFEDAKTVRRLRGDMARLLVLNRALIRLLINSNVISLAELTDMAKEINALEEPIGDEDMEVCKDCGRHSYRARANCVYCGSLKL